jgi:uncharacterized membrane protein
MSGAGFAVKEVRPAEPRRASVNHAIAFILPSIVVTAVSIVLFARLTDLTVDQHNVFSITVLAAIILSLVGMAGMQLLIYRITDDRDYYADGGASRGTRLGIVYGVIFSAVVSVLTAPYFMTVLNFSVVDFFYFAYLLLLYSVVWVVVSGFWASEQYMAPAIMFVISYALIFAATLAAYQTNPAYAMAGFAVGTTVLLTVFLVASAIKLQRPAASHPLWGDFSRLPKLAFQNAAAIAFAVLYVVGHLP